jgi:hypothetical protein
VGSSAAEEKEPLPGLEPPIIQPVAQGYTTELSRSFVVAVIVLTDIFLSNKKTSLFQNIP